MRHRVYGKHLSRDKNERTALFRSLVQSLLATEKIKTTEAKAKAIKGLVDKIINQAKISSNKPLINQYVIDKKIVQKLTDDIAPRYKERISGYTSVVKLGQRQGDGAMLVQMSLIEEKKEKVKSEKKSKVTN